MPLNRKDAAPASPAMSASLEDIELRIHVVTSRLTMATEYYGRLRTAVLPQEPTKSNSVQIAVLLDGKQKIITFDLRILHILDGADKRHIYVRNPPYSEDIRESVREALREYESHIQETQSSILKRAIALLPYFS